MVEFQQGLLITAIGMGLVFVVIILLWGLMALMMRVTSVGSQIDENIEDNPTTDIPVITETKNTEEKKRAAVAAVSAGIAMTKAHVKIMDRKMERTKGALSPWQTVHRLRQLEKRKR